MARVLIIGAGPAGASLALLLASRGVEVTLLERRRDFAREFRGEVLMPSGVAALREMGLDGELAALPTAHIDHADVYLNRRHILSQSLAGAAAGPVLAVSQPALLEMLVRRAGEFPGFRFLRGVSVKDFVIRRERLAAAEVKGPAGSETLAADLVIGADGRHSVVRRAAGLRALAARAPMDVVWFKLPCPADFRGVRACAGRGHLLFAYRTWGDRLQIGWVILKGAFGDLREQGIDRWAEQMIAHVPADLGEHLRRHRHALEHPFLLNVVSDRVASWRGRGALVIGDAAHTMSPVGAQGLNIALRDALVAANHLVPALRGGHDLDPVLAALEAERTPEVNRIQALQALPPRLLLSQAWWGDGARTLAAALLGVPAVRRRAGRRAQPFLEGVRPVRLQV